MRSYNIPPDAVGDGAESDFINRTLKRSGELQFYDSQTVKVEQTTRGVRWHAKIPPPVQGEAPVVKKHPFKVYQPTNFASFTTGFVFRDPTSGVATVCNIDATKPTNLDATPPTVNPGTDAWRFWAVRSGYCEYRPVYSLAIALRDYSNNYGLILPVDLTDRVEWTYKGQDFSDSTTNTNTPPIVMYGPPPGPHMFTGMVLWIKITSETDNDSGYTVAIAGALMSEAHGSPQFISGFPQIGPNAILLAEIYPGRWWSNDSDPNYYFTTDFVVNQILDDHVLNRYPPGNGNYLSGLNPYTTAHEKYVVGGIMNMRGVMDFTMHTNDPADLDAQVFYPGDVVSVTWVVTEPTDTVEGVIGNALYIFSQIFPANLPDIGDTTGMSQGQIVSLTFSGWKRITYSQYAG